MTRNMIDTTHDGFPVALAEIRKLAPGDAVALYDTGSPDIAATPTDIRQIPAQLHVVMIDQGFTGSPNPAATVRDCEKGAWPLGSAVVTVNWHATRPTLYLGFPDTVQMAHDAGWRGDVWIVVPSKVPPASPPTVPPGLNVVAVQWGFSSPDFDRSVIFDPTWPLKGGDPVTTPPPVQKTVRVQQNWRWCSKCQGLFQGDSAKKSVCPAGGEHDGSNSFEYILTGLY